MNKKKNISTKTLRKQKLREMRLKKLEQKLKDNIYKRKKNILKDRDG
jgi:hypothetical protein